MSFHLHPHTLEKSFLIPNLGEGGPRQEQREDVGRVEADEAAGVGSGLCLGLGAAQAEAEEARGGQQRKLRIKVSLRVRLRPEF